MRGIYICNYNLKNNASGVNKKINSQIQIFNNFDIGLLVLDRNCLKKEKSDSFLHNFLDALKGCSSPDMVELLEIAEKNANSDKYDFIYIRKGLLDTEQINVIKK